MAKKKKKPLYKRWWFITIVAILVIGIFGSDNEDKPKDAEKDPMEQSENKEDRKKNEENKEETEKEEEKSTEDLLEEKGLVDSIDFYEGELTITYEPDTMWSENSLMGVVNDMLDNLPIAFKDDKVDSVVNGISVAMIDNKGNEEVKQVITYRYTREEYEELNYDKFKEMSMGEEWRILNEANSYFIHPSIRSKLKDKYTDNLN